MSDDCEKPGVRRRISRRGIRVRIWLGAWARRSLIRPGSVLLGFIATIYAVCQLLKEEELPFKEAWDRHHPLGWLLVVTGLMALVGTLLFIFGYAREVRKSEQRDELAELCRAIWHQAVMHLGVDMNKVGVHIWEVRGIKGFRYLDRRATFVLEPRRRTGVVWHKGKGAIGVAWDEDEPKVANVEHLSVRATSQRLFCDLPREERFGLTWREFRRSKHYRAILAIPLRRSGNVRGCLSVDIQVDGQADKLDTLSQDEQFNNVLAVCEAVLAKRR